MYALHVGYREVYMIASIRLSVGMVINCFLYEKTVCNLNSVKNLKH